MQKQKGTGILSAPKRPRCCARCPKPFTIFVSSLVVALVLIVGFMIGHYAAPYIQTMVSCQALLAQQRPGSRVVRPWLSMMRSPRESLT